MWWGVEDKMCVIKENKRKCGIKYIEILTLIVESEINSKNISKLVQAIGTKKWETNIKRSSEIILGIDWEGW